MATKKIIWESLYNDLPTHVAVILREARLKPEQIALKTDGELLSIAGITEKDVESIRLLYSPEDAEVAQVTAEKEAAELAGETIVDGEVKAVKKVAPRKRSAKYLAMAKTLKRDETNDIAKAIEILAGLAKNSKLKTVELHINVREASVRGEIKLPHSTGKEVKIAIFNDTVAAAINSGNIDFDILLATPADMPKLARFAKILGPKGLMPNPRNGTVTPEPEKRAADLAAGGTLPYKTEAKFPIIHLGLGSITQDNKDLLDNVTEVLRTIGVSRIKTAFLSCTHTPSVRLSLSEIK